MARVHLQPAYILHRRPYKETSLIIDCFTQDFGRLSLIAKGAKRAKSHWAGVLQMFNLLEISWTGKSEMGTLTDAELKQSIGLTGRKIYNGMYINELLVRLLHIHEPLKDLFFYYSQTLIDLENCHEVEIPLRLFEKQLLIELGYGLNLIADHQTDLQIDAKSDYFYDVEVGPGILLKADTGRFSISGKTLIALEENDLSSKEVQREAKMLFRYILQHYLSHKPLKSRELYSRRHDINRLKE